MAAILQVQPHLSHPDRHPQQLLHNLPLHLLLPHGPVLPAADKLLRVLSEEEASHVRDPQHYVLLGLPVGLPRRVLCLLYGEAELGAGVLGLLSEFRFLLRALFLLRPAANASPFHSLSDKLFHATEDQRRGQKVQRGDWGGGIR